jgi:hypothetical protein
MISSSNLGFIVQKSKNLIIFIFKIYFYLKSKTLKSVETRVSARGERSASVGRNLYFEFLCMD